MEATIRLATCEDLPSISRITEEVWAATYPLLEKQITTQALQGYFERRRKDPREAVQFCKDRMLNVAWHLFVIEEEETVCGYADVIESVETVELKSIYLLPAFQGRGFGKALLRHALKDYEGKKIIVNVARSNIRAQRFYTQCGFKANPDVHAVPFILDDSIEMEQIQMKRD